MRSAAKKLMPWSQCEARCPERSMQKDAIRPFIRGMVSPLVDGGPAMFRNAFRSLPHTEVSMQLHDIASWIKRKCQPAQTNETQR